MADPYAANGHALLAGLFAHPEVDAWRAECDRVAALPGLFDPANLRTHVAGSATRELDRIDPVIDLSPIFAELAYDPRLVDAARWALGSEPCLMKDKLILKPPGATGYGLHQDAAYFPPGSPEPGAVVIAVVFVDPSDESNGGLELVDGCHQRLLTRVGVPEDVPQERVADAPMTRVRADAGDVVLFHALTPHRSGDNCSGRPRRHLYFTYSAALAGDFYHSYYRSQHERLRAQAPLERRASLHFT